MYRYLAVVFFFLSGCIGFTTQSFGQDLCISDYFGIGSITLFKEFNGVSSSDPIILFLYSVLALIFSGILAFVKNKKIYISLALIFTFFEIFILNLFETDSIKSVLIDSIFKCSNYSLAISAFFLILHWLFNILFVVKSKV